MESERASTFSAIVRRVRGNESACGEMCKRNTESRREKKKIAYEEGCSRCDDANRNYFFFFESLSQMLPNEMITMLSI